MAPISTMFGGGLQEMTIRICTAYHDCIGMHMAKSRCSKAQEIFSETQVFDMVMLLTRW